MPINTHAILPVEAKSSPQLTQWLLQKTSLTAQLQKIKGEAKAKLIAQQWIKPTWWDINLLNIQDKLVFQREILMESHGVAYWYARSIIPQKCYELDAVFFNRLQNESIRNLIFGDERVQRLHLFNYPIDKLCVEYYWVKKFIKATKEILWVRLAEFRFHAEKKQERASFYLVEILLPELENIIL